MNSTTQLHNYSTAKTVELDNISMFELSSVVFNNLSPASCAKDHAYFLDVCERILEAQIKLATLEASINEMNAKIEELRC